MQLYLRLRNGESGRKEQIQEWEKFKARRARSVEIEWQQEDGNTVDSAEGLCGGVGAGVVGGGGGAGSRGQRKKNKKKKQKKKKKKKNKKNA